MIVGVLVVVFELVFGLAAFVWLGGVRLVAGVVLMDCLPL